MYIRLEDVQVMRCRIRLLFVIRQKGVVPSLIKEHVLHLFLLQWKTPGVVGVVCGVWPRLVCHTGRYDMRGGEGNTALHRCDKRMLRLLLKMILRMLGRAGLNVTTNGIMLDFSLMDVSRALLRGI